MATTIARPVGPPRAHVRQRRMLHGRETQTVLQIKDRVWQAKIHKVERIEEEEDRLWALRADWIEANTSDETVPWEVVRRELGLDRPE